MWQLEQEASPLPDVASRRRGRAGRPRLLGGSGLWSGVASQRGARAEVDHLDLSCRSGSARRARPLASSRTRPPGPRPSRCSWRSRRSGRSSRSKRGILDRRRCRRRRSSPSRRPPRRACCRRSRRRAAAASPGCVRSGRRSPRGPRRSRCGACRSRCAGSGAAARPRARLGSITRDARLGEMALHRAAAVVARALEAHVVRQLGVGDVDASRCRDCTTMLKRIVPTWSNARPSRRRGCWRRSRTRRDRAGSKLTRALQSRPAASRQALPSNFTITPVSGAGSPSDVVAGAGHTAWARAAAAREAVAARRSR